ncbi:microtubule-associated protein tau isoform X3 [Drosophila elegans]|uniref:microtubule-associated protein tau isoform X3 n=1 Tax=Drosophila elegans TaxID=30023 RepID=UPI0007E6E44F|nr:microtubule-associated protein tau isoform X3 [Drosophila elegans]
MALATKSCLSSPATYWVTRHLHISAPTPQARSPSSRMYGTAKERSSQQVSQEDYPLQQQQRGQSKSEYLPADRSNYGLESEAVDRPKQQLRSQPAQEATDSAVDRSKPQLGTQPNSSTTLDSVPTDRSRQQLRTQQNPEYLSNVGASYEAARGDQPSLNRNQQQPLRSQPAADYSSNSFVTERQQRPQPTTIDYTGYNAPLPPQPPQPKDRTFSRSNSKPTISPQPKLQSKPNPEYVRPPQNFVLPPQMRPAVGPPQPRPPFAGARPMVGMVGPRPPMPPNMGARPPPLRTTDSKSNLLMGPPMRPGMPPQLNMQQARLPNSGGPLSPPGQGPPRPPGGFPWNPAGAPGMPPGARPPQNMTRPPPPTFARPPPGQPLQAPFRPSFNQPPMQPQPLPQQLQQQQQQQQHLQQQPPPQQLRPLSAHNNDDDDDVVMGPAVTPLKTFNARPDPMGEPLLEDIEPPFETSPPAGDARKGPGFKGDNDSGVDESTQEKDRNGPISPSSPVKTPTSTSSKPDKSGTSRPPSATPSNKSAPKSRSASKNRLLLKTPEPEPAKKVPMNKVQVGHAPSPNLKAVRSKIGSLDNATYKPGGGHVKIESKKIDIKAAPRIEAKNDKYMPKGGEKKIVTTKLQWNAKSKIGSLENAAHKPGGGDKKIETLKMDFKDKAKPKVGSTSNVKHQPGGGDIKDNNPKDIQTQKLEIKAQSKVGSLDNVKHKPGGGEKKIFDDKDYLKNVEHSVALTTPPTQFAAQGRLIATIHLEFGLCNSDCVCNNIFESLFK